MSAEQRNAIRDRIRRQRRDLPRAEREAAAKYLLIRLAESQAFYGARHIAAYYPNDGEIDTWPVIRHAWHEGRSVYLPVIRKNRTLAFAALLPDTALQNNRYGIPEPKHADKDLIAVNELDLVLMPLAAFDSKLFRLGMGSGYYDRTLAEISQACKTQPELIGVGYDFQRVDTVFPQHWDVPADIIVTDKNIYNKVSTE